MKKTLFHMLSSFFEKKNPMHTLWLICVQGEHGDDGDTGPSGKVGSRGKAGGPGLPGEQGSFGAKVEEFR